jgi:hypothetical protein
MSETTDLKDLKELAEAATPGPWKHHKEAGPYASRDEVWCDSPCKDEPDWSCPVVDDIIEQDAKFIAAANPKTVLELIARVEAAEGALEHSKSATQHWCEVALEGSADDALRTALEQAKAREAELIAFARLVRDLPVKNKNMPHGVWLDGKKHTGPIADWLCGEFMPKLKRAAVTAMGGDDNG